MAAVFCRALRLGGAMAEYRAYAIETDRKIRRRGKRQSPTTTNLRKKLPKVSSLSAEYSRFREILRGDLFRSALRDGGRS
jgi:hypothetical protein